jgi:acetyl-CoA acetyltransferase
MPFEKAFIPYGAYYSTPFCRWQGSLSSQHAIKLAAQSVSRFLGERKIAPESLDGLVLGWTVVQRHYFYGAPWLAGMIGATGVGGTMVSQACATSARALCAATLDVEAGLRECVLAVGADRTSNGAHIYYPDPGGPGGLGEAENPVWDNFSKDPYAGEAMIRTAENAARETGIGRAEQDAMALLRYEQYQAALADGRAFQRRYMLAVELGAGKKTRSIEADEGGHPITREGLAGLKPVLEGGSVTGGTQTFPADGNAALLVCSRERAERLSRDPKLPVRLLAFGEARVGRGLMPLATVPAARAALERAGIGARDCRAVKTHNPFALNDVYLCRELGLAPESVNRYGSPLVWGHPQAPTGLRAVIELCEELALAGGGHGLFAGCAAGDTAMAVVVRVG